jgi:hypothetical protein
VNISFVFLCTCIYLISVFVSFVFAIYSYRIASSSEVGEGTLRASSSEDRIASSSEVGEGTLRASSSEVGVRIVRVIPV